MIKELKKAKVATTDTSQSQSSFFVYLSSVTVAIFSRKKDVMRHKAT